MSCESDEEYGESSEESAQEVEDEWEAEDQEASDLEEDEITYFLEGENEEDQELSEVEEDEITYFLEGENEEDQELSEVEEDVEEYSLEEEVECPPEIYQEVDEVFHAGDTPQNIESTTMMSDITFEFAIQESSHVSSPNHSYGRPSSFGYNSGLSGSRGNKTGGKITRSKEKAKISKSGPGDSRGGEIRRSKENAKICKPKQNDFEHFEGYESKFIDQILLSGNRGKKINNGRWNILLSGSTFTNAGKVGHAKLPTAIYQGNKLVIPSMYVKDILDASESKSAMSLPVDQLLLGVNMGLKVRMTRRSLTARKFHTSEVDVSKLFKDCRVVLHLNRFFVHDTTGDVNVCEALERTVNTGSEIELVLSKKLAKQLADFIVWLNRVRGYGCAEFASIGCGWFAVQNIELLGPENKGYAAVNNKSKGWLGSRRYKKEFEQSRSIGTLRTGCMFEEYNSPNGQFHGPLEVRTRSKLYKILPGGIVADGSEDSQLDKMRIDASYEEIDNSSTMSQNSYPSAVTTTVTYGADGSKETIQVFPDGSRHLSRTPAKPRMAAVAGKGVSSKKKPTSGSHQSTKIIKGHSSVDLQGILGSTVEIGEKESGRRHTSQKRISSLQSSQPSTAGSSTQSLNSNSSFGSVKPTNVNSVYVPRPNSGRDNSFNDERPQSLKEFGTVESGVMEINANGMDGIDGLKGTPGRNGTRDGDPGTDGQDGTRPSIGGHASNVIISLRVLGNKKKGGIAVTFDDPNDGTTTKRDELIFDLCDFPTICISAKGGRGGNGGRGGHGGNGHNGFAGDDATLFQNGTVGGDGGRGGDGGLGYSGAQGGNGGCVEVHVRKADAFLLSFLSDTCKESPDSIVSKGSGGNAGAHGKSGKGGSGGKGGSSFKKVVKRETVERPGGDDGRNGKDGSSPRQFLNGGSPGRTGSFVIKTLDDNEVYSGIFDIQLLNFDINGSHPLNQSSFEIGSKLSVSSVRVLNSGKMTFPAGQLIRFEIAVYVKDTDPCFKHFLTEQTAECELQLSEALECGEEAVSSGMIELASNQLFERLDNFLDPTAFEVALEVRASLVYGDNGDFSSLFKNATVKQTLTFAYPIENRTGIQGPVSICPEEYVRFDFTLSNISGGDLGRMSSSEREVSLSIQLYDENKEMNNDVRIAVIPSQSTMITSADENLVGESGYSYPLSTIEGQSDISTSFCLCSKNCLQPYQRITLRIDVKLEAAFTSDNDARQMLTIQSRNLLLACEPCYEPTDVADIVLITSTATSFETYNCWVSGVLESMGLITEVYSITRYGSLDPDFFVENECTLRQAFADKLVVVLNDSFSLGAHDMKKISPLDLFPTEGRYCDTTRWLIVTDSKGDEMQRIPKALITAQKYKKLKFQSVTDMQVHVQNMIKQESTGIQVPHFAVLEAASNEATSAEDVAKWVAKLDKVRQYSVLKSSGSIQMHVEQNRSLNSGVIATAPKGCSGHIPSLGMILAIAEALSMNQRLCALCDNLRENRPAVESLRIAATSEYIREVSYLADASIVVNDDVEDCCPTIASFTDNLYILHLIEDCQHDIHLKERVCQTLSDLLGRFRAVADSKDLRRRLMSNLSAKNSATTTLLSALEASIKRIQRQWRSVVDGQMIESVKSTLKEDVYALLGIDRSPANHSKRSIFSKGSDVNVRADNSWMHGLAYLHSNHNPDLCGSISVGIRPMTSSRIAEINGLGLRSMSSQEFRIARPFPTTLSEQVHKKYRTHVASCIKKMKKEQIQRNAHVVVRRDEELEELEGSADSSEYSE